MNVFLYDLLKKAKSWAWSIASLGGLLILGGCYLSQSETVLDRLASVFTGDPKSEDVIGTGVMFVLVGLIWKPACTFIMSSLEKTFTVADRDRLGLTPKTNAGVATAPAPSASVSTAPVTPESPVLAATQEQTLPPPATSVPKPMKREGTFWLPIPSLVIGLLTAVTLFGDSGTDSDTAFGTVYLALVGLALGIITLFMQRKGRRMAITGIILNVVAILGWIGKLTDK